MNDNYDESLKTIYKFRERLTALNPMLDSLTNRLREICVVQHINKCGRRFNLKELINHHNEIYKSKPVSYNKAQLTMTNLVDQGFVDRVRNGIYRLSKSTVNKYKLKHPS